MFWLHSLRDIAGKLKRKEFLCIFTCRSAIEPSGRRTITVCRSFAHGTRQASSSQRRVMKVFHALPSFSTCWVTAAQYDLMRGIPRRRRLSASMLLQYQAKNFPLTGALSSHSVFIVWEWAVALSVWAACVVSGLTTALTPADQCVPLEARSSCSHQLASAHTTRALADSYSTPTLAVRTIVEAPKLPRKQWNWWRLQTSRLMMARMVGPELSWTPAMMFWGIVSGQTCHLLNTCGQQGSDWRRTCQWTLAVAGLSAQHIGGILSTRWTNHSLTGLPITRLFMELMAYIQRSRPLFTLIRAVSAAGRRERGKSSLGFSLSEQLFQHL